MTEENRKRIDRVFHDYLNEDINYGKCHAHWSKVRYLVDDEKEMRTLVERVKEAAKVQEEAGS